MITLTKLQVELIRGDIRQNGVELSDLEDDLLDHVCCAIESEHVRGNSFEEIYEKVKQQIFPDGYREIQKETTQLLIQKYSTMKKSMNVFGILGSALLLIGSILKALHLFGAGILLASGTVLLIGGYLPVLLVISLKQTDTMTGRIRNISGYVGANLIIVSIVSQILHYPWGKEMMISGLIIFLLLFIPLFFRSAGKEAMMKIQPATLTVMLIAIISSLFAFNIKRPSNQYTSSLLNVNRTIEKAYRIKHERLLDIRKAETPLSEASENTLLYIDQLKKYLVSTVDKNNPTENLNLYNIFIFDKKLNDILVYNKNHHAVNGPELYDRLHKFVQILHRQHPGIKTFLPDQESAKEWTEENFLDKPLYGIYTTLSNIQLELTDLQIEISGKNEPAITMNSAE